MSEKLLIIVESPTKAKTIGKFLGKDYKIIASGGHVFDLPKSSLGVDLEDNFKPEYKIITLKKKIFSEIKKQVKNNDIIYLATDPDREGEAISWHIMQNLDGKSKRFFRLIFHEVTKDAFKEAIAHPLKLNPDMVNAQTARRVLDRIVGYFLSPLLWKKVVRGLSAGRVQSVALRLIVEREKEILAFKSQEYWQIEAELETRKGKNEKGKTFIARLEKIENKKVEIDSKQITDEVVEDIKKQEFVVSDVVASEKKRNPYAPFITSTMQQDAFNKLRFSAAKTMKMAQELYEGIEIEGRGAFGLITYMRTDSPRVNDQALASVRNFISQTYGKEYLPESPNIYRAKKSAQEAHEAIRPTALDLSLEELEKILDKDQFKLYELIYKRFIASQMKPAVYSLYSIEIIAGKYLFKASASQIKFKGFTAAYDIEEDETKNKLPELTKKEKLNLVQLTPSQHFTKPPARFSEGSLVKKLEEDGIGRPSTYAPIIQTLTFRQYVNRLKGYLQPTDLGIKVSDLLVENFPKIMDVKFTAHMEDDLDEVEEGKLDWVKLIRDFYAPFKDTLDAAYKGIEKEVVQTNEICPDCGKNLIVKWGRRGRFLSCPDFPKCKFSKSITTGVKCPNEGCGGELVERRSRRGVFYGCSNFPKCNYIANNLPEQLKDNG
ncbi:MAG: type I DNA topoisomerase [Candidatus Omnitrophota bacterium]